MNSYITDVPGIKVGHVTKTSRPTGCTVILFEEGATASVDVRGGAPGTRETDLLSPTSTVEHIHALAIAGGSAFGLDIASGVTRYLDERTIGFDTGYAKIPIVPAAVIYDLQLGDSSIRPTVKDGYDAAVAAQEGAFELGNVGAGTGATVGKIFGHERCMRGGLGSASLRVGSILIGALAVVNALGDIIDPSTGYCVAGARGQDGTTLMDSLSALRAGKLPKTIWPGSNTTIGVVATNVSLTKTEAKKLAEMAQDGLARAINPVHTPYDGDVVFAASTNKLTTAVNLALLGTLAADVLSKAVLSGVFAAKSYEKIPAAADFHHM
ncbi:MAG: P1 family peptidase [Blastocatellia bacterium]|nr:P1 family peptidase [Blastocatellia bacterium]